MQNKGGARRQRGGTDKTVNTGWRVPLTVALEPPVLTRVMWP